MRSAGKPCRGLGVAVRGKVLTLTWIAALAWAAAASAGTPKLLQEEYYAVYLSTGATGPGAKCGYLHVQVLAERQADREVIRTHTHTEMTVHRFGQASRNVVTTDEYETVDGQLLRATAQTEAGGSRLSVVGVVDGRLLKVTITNVGGRREVTLPLEGPVAGSQGLENRLRREALSAGRTFAFKSFLPTLPAIVGIEAKVIGRETTDLLDGRRELWRIEATMDILPGAPMVVWTDDQHVSWKQHWASMGGLTFYRVSAAEALAPAQGQSLDLALRSLVKLDRPLPDPYAVKEAVYDITLKPPALSKHFNQPPAQSVLSDSGDGRLRLRVRQQRPLTVGPGRVADEYLKPNAYIQSDDPAVVALAREAAGEATDRLEVVRRLTGWVHRHVAVKDYSTAFATASDVARQRHGDCSEHAVLLAALARAAGIPSRVAVGLLYLERTGAFAYHMWTEVWLGTWVGIDGTGAWVGVPATHIKVADSSMSDGSGLTALLPVAPLIGNVEIRLVSYRH